MDEQSKNEVIDFVTRWALTLTNEDFERHFENYLDGIRCLFNDLDEELYSGIEGFDKLRTKAISDFRDNAGDDISTATMMLKGVFDSYISLKSLSAGALAKTRGGEH